MPTKIRLQRHGRKAKAFYHIVIADGRAPRDGRFIEKIGTYNPLTKPADIDLDFDRALHWLQTGAQPTDTVRAILSYKGILFKFHLLNGVKKGALTPEQVEEKFNAWLGEKESKIKAKVKEQELLQKEGIKKVKEEESKLNEARAAELAKKQAKEAEKKAAKLRPVIEAQEEAVAEPEDSTTENEPIAETPVASEPEVIVEEAKEPVAVSEVVETAEVAEPTMAKEVAEEIVPDAAVAESNEEAEETQEVSPEKPE